MENNTVFYWDDTDNANEENNMKEYNDEYDTDLYDDEVLDGWW